MDNSHCPIGALRKEEQRISALGLQIALDDLRLRWSWQAQAQYDAKKSTADKALTKWNEHVQYCPTCRGVLSALGSVTVQAKSAPSPVLLLVDDNSELLELLVGMLQPKYTIAAAISNGVAAVELTTAFTPDVILLDISLGDISGFEVARRLKRAECPARIIFLTLHEDMDFASAAFGLGASGYVFKSRLNTDLENAIDTVLSGGHFSSIG